MARKTPPTGKITTIHEALEKAGIRPAETDAQAKKKNYAEQLSRNISTCIANALRGRFPGIMPHEDGLQQESPARTAKGLKKLDVNYSTPQLGLALGVSVKTISFRDSATNRYTKNYSRNDNELRAEATDYHQRQPYAVLVAVLFLPFDSCDDAGGARRKADDTSVSSFGAAVKYFRARANRKTPRDDIDLFERFFVAVYEPDGNKMGDTAFFDVMKPPPKNRRPAAAETVDFAGLIQAIDFTYRMRNEPPFRWADDPEP
jgi:hypothetical protein